VLSSRRMAVNCHVLLPLANRCRRAMHAAPGVLAVMGLAVGQPCNEMCGS
jgi:hypothetical protein